MERHRERFEGDERQVAGGGLRSTPTPSDLIATLGATARALLDAGPPPLPPDVLADVLRLAAAAAGNDATRAGKASMGNPAGGAR